MASTLRWLVMASNPLQVAFALAWLHLHGVDGATSDVEHWNGWVLLAVRGDRTSDNPLSPPGGSSSFGLHIERESKIGTLGVARQPKGEFSNLMFGLWGVCGCVFV
jgi:hypothetical protein